MWLGHVPWAGRHWALPVLIGAFDPLLPTAGTPAQEAHRLGPPAAPLAPPTPGAGGRQQLCRAGFAPLLLEPVTLIARLRLDAALYAAPPRQRQSPAIEGPAAAAAESFP